MGNQIKQGVFFLLCFFLPFRIALANAGILELTLPGKCPEFWCDLLGDMGQMYPAQYPARSDLCVAAVAGLPALRLRLPLSEKQSLRAMGGGEIGR